MKKTLFIFIILGIILSINGGFASIAANSSVYLRNTLYGPGDALNAIAVLGLENEKANSNVVISIGGKNVSMSLLDFLEKAGILDSDYQCTNDCQNTYNVSGAGKSAIDLKAGENLVGLKLSNDPEESLSIETLEFKISPPNTALNFKKGCGESVVKIDVLDNGIDWQFLNASEFSYACNPLSLNDECYSENNAKDFGITSSLYCEKKFLKETSKVKLAAKVRKATEASTGDMKMSILDPSDNMKESDECDLIEPASTDYSIQECVLDYNIKKAGDYYICIKDDKYSSGNAGYYVLGERIAPVCGFVNSILGVKADFALYSQIADIAEFPAFSLNNKMYKEATGEELDRAINNYLSSFYSNLCYKGCIIPINIKTTGDAKISDLKAGYFSEALLYPSSPFDIYNVIREPPLVSMAKKTINLDFLGLTVNGIGSYKLTFTVGNNVIGEDYLNVSSIPKIYSITPKNPVAGVETPFFANVMSPAGYKITSYEWDFGDGAVKTTGNNTVLHAYSVFGEHNLSLTITDEKGTKASASFLVNPQTPKDAVNSTISRKKSLLDSFMASVNALPSWYSTIITQKYETQDLNEKITRALKDFDEAEETGVNETYLFIKDRIDAMLVPESLEETQTLEETGSLLMINEINPDYIKNLGGGTYKDAEEARSAIAAWQSENINIKISGSVKTVTFEDLIAEDALTIFQARLTSLQLLKETYFVIVLPSGISYEDVKFDKNYGQKKLDNAIGISLSGTGETINFAMPGSQILTISMFASPPLDSLVFVPKIVTCGNGICEKESGENSKNCREDCPATARTIMWIVFIIVLGAIGVFLIWKFYAVIYERMEQRRIFKTRKNYISLLIFIADVLKKGFTEQQITEKLKKSGWNDEQIGYAMKQSMKAEKKAEKKIRARETKETKK